jgi:hypothetical protein
MYPLRVNWDIDGLHALAKSISKRDVIVELGCAYGESTEIFAGYFKRVYAIDPWAPDPEAMERFDGVVSRHSNIIKLRGYDIEFLDQFDLNSLDTVYVDAEHTYPALRKNIYDWLPKIKVDGVIAGHDYNPVDWPGVVEAVNEIFGKPDVVFEDTSWLVNLGAR